MFCILGFIYEYEQTYNKDYPFYIFILDSNSVLRKSTQWTFLCLQQQPVGLSANNNNKNNVKNYNSIFRNW